MKRLTCVLATAMLAAAPAWAADAYTIDGVASQPVFQVLHLGFVTQRGRFNRVAGHLSLDVAHRQGSVVFTIEAPSLDMGSPAWNAHMADEGLFNSAVFPTITFKSEQFTFDGPAVVAADGTLTMLGITRPVHLVVQHFKCGPHPQTGRALCGGDISATLRRSDFGLTRYLDSVGDEVRIDAPVMAYRD